MASAVHFSHLKGGGGDDTASPYSASPLPSAPKSIFSTMHLRWIVDFQKSRPDHFLAFCPAMQYPSQLHRELNQFETANLGPKEPMAAEPCSTGSIGFRVPSWQDEHFAHFAA